MLIQTRSPASTGRFASGWRPLRLACCVLFAFGCGAPEGDDEASGEMGDAVTLTTRYLRPPSVCPHNGDGTAHTCAASNGGHGAFNTWSSSSHWLPAGTLLLVDGDWDVRKLILFNSSGRSANWTRITSYNPAAPARLKGVLPGLLYGYASYVELDHLRIDNDVGTCVMLGSGESTSHNINLHDMTFDRCANGVSLRTVEDVAIARNVFKSVGGTADGLRNHGHCIYPAEGAKRIDVYRNRCIALPDVYASYCLHVYHAEPPGPASSVKFHDNVCEGFSTGAGMYSGATDIRVYGNTFMVRPKRPGICKDRNLKNGNTVIAAYYAV